MLGDAFEEPAPRGEEFVAVAGGTVDADEIPEPGL
jgi:hypothetical protein